MYYSQYTTDGTHNDMTLDENIRVPPGTENPGVWNPQDLEPLDSPPGSFGVVPYGCGQIHCFRLRMRRTLAEWLRAERLPEEEVNVVAEDAQTAQNYVVDAYSKTHRIRYDGRRRVRKGMEFWQ